MKRRMLGVAVGILVALGCRTIPGQDVRYQPTPMAVVRAMLELAEVGPEDVVYDLGSGDGRIPITAAREFGARGVGIEIDPALVALAEANAREARVQDRVEFRLGNMYAADVRPATVVTLFLHPQPNLKLRPKLQSELRPGSRIVSYIWDMGDWAPEEVRRVARRRIFLWRIPPTGPNASKAGGRSSPARRRPESRSAVHASALSASVGSILSARHVRMEHAISVTPGTNTTIGPRSGSGNTRSSGKRGTHSAQGAADVMSSASLSRAAPRPTRTVLCWS